jgi:large subunit ribosomal protein L3
MKMLITQKKGMTQLYNDKGNVVPVTILDVKENVIVGKKSVEKDGYSALVIGRGSKKASSKSEMGKFKGLKAAPKWAKEVKVQNAEDIDALNVGDAVSIDFEVGDKVVVTGESKGKGFQGVVKRWGFHGGPKTHGQSDRQRHPGSIGSGTTPGRVYKGKKMGGRMGNDTKTIKGLKVMVVDKENGLIAVSGPVPGSRGDIVLLKKLN